MLENSASAVETKDAMSLTSSILQSRRAASVPQNFAVKALLKTRFAIGKGLGWDKIAATVQSSSYIHRLTENDRRLSLFEPGSKISPEDPFVTVYVLPGEALLEIINKTVHAFLLIAIRPAEFGYFGYWAVYIKKTGWVTPLYMWLITPFRKLLVYPSTIRKIERDWARAFA